MINTLILLLFGHALADYPLQGDFLAKAKNPNFAIPGIPWVQAMAAHCMIHAGFVFVITQSPVLAFVEFVAHFITDKAKCEARIGFNTDQAIHVACKLGYVLYIGLAGA